MNSICACGCKKEVKKNKSMYCQGHHTRLFPRRPARPIEERFWEYVKKTKTCWIWIGPKNRAGYGRFHKQGQEKILAHRFSLQLHGTNLTRELLACHRCDRTECVNPEHLYAGTQSDNMGDAAERKRMPNGNKHWNFKGRWHK